MDFLLSNRLVLPLVLQVTTQQIFRDTVSLLGADFDLLFTNLPVDNVYTIIIAILICIGKYCQSSKYQPSLPGRCEDNIPGRDRKKQPSFYLLPGYVKFYQRDRKKQLSFYLLPGYVKFYQREIKLFEFSRDTNREELMI